MPTFGQEPFGNGRFGRGSWGDRVLWGNIPVQHQMADAAAGGYLQGLLATWADALEEVRDQISALPDQRDPYAVRGIDGTEEWLYADAVEWLTDPIYGPVAVLREPALVGAWPHTPTVNAGAWTPYAPITRVGPAWSVSWAGATYRVVAVRRRLFDALNPAWSDANEVLLAGVPLGTWPTAQYGVPIGVGNGGVAPVVTVPHAPFRFARHTNVLGPPWPVAGVAVTVYYPSVVAGAWVPLYDVPSDPYDGTGQLCPPVGGDPTTIDHTVVLGTVDYECGRITLDLTPAGDTTTAGAAITADWRVAGYYLPLRPASLLPYLARDFGFENDLNEPENVQRSTIAHAVNYFGRKATWDSYRIRGEISGFQVDAQPLHLLGDPSFALLLPSDRVYTYGGKTYTTIEPRACRFDEVSADVQWYNPYTVAYDVLLDDCFLYADASEDDRSTGLAFALDVVQGWNDPAREPATVIAARALTDVEVDAYGVVGGILVEVEMLADAKADWTFRRAGTFGLTQYDLAGGVVPSEADAVWWVDREVDLVAAPGDPTRVRWTVLVAQVATAPLPVVGADTAVRYWPELLYDSCGYCRSNRIRVAVEPIPGAWGAEVYYATALAQDAAVQRLIAKIGETLVPIHVRVLEYALTFYTYITVPPPVLAPGTLDETYVTTVLAFDTFDLPGVPADDEPLDGDVKAVVGALEVVATYDLLAVQAGATIDLLVDPTDWVAGATSILLTVQQRGDLEAVGETQTVAIRDGAGATVWSVTGAQSGFDDLTWRDVAGAVAVDLTSLLSLVSPVTLRASATADVANGEVRYIFTVTR